MKRKRNEIKSNDEKNNNVNDENNGDEYEDIYFLANFDDYPLELFDINKNVEISAIVIFYYFKMKLESRYRKTIHEIK